MSFHTLPTLTNPTLLLTIRVSQVRCDKTLHCSSCKQSMVPCERKLQLKHKTKAQRVLISPE